MRRALSEKTTQQDDRAADIIIRAIRRQGGAAKVAQVLGWRRGSLQARMDRKAAWTVGELLELIDHEILSSSTLRMIGLSRRTKYSTDLPDALRIRH